MQEKGTLASTNCIRCHRQIQATPFCPFCGAKQERKRGLKTRGNGQGTAFKRGKTWTARVVIGWRTDGEKHAPVYRSKGGFRTKNEALAACPGLLELQTVAKPTSTFAQIFDEWRAEYEPRIKPSTMAGYVAAYKHFAPLHYRKFVDILPGDLQACMDACKNGKRTKEVMKAFASLLYKYAMHNELVSRNRAETLYTGDGEKVAREAITLDELERIRAAVPSEPYAAYVLCLCYLGFRPGELLGLKKAAYNPQKMTIVGGGKTKAGKDRTVTVSPKIAAILEERAAYNSEYLFPRLSNGERMTDNYFRKFCFDPLMNRLGIVDRVPYSCRHTFANLLKAVRGSDTDKAALMGHADASMTKYYQEADLSSLKEITDAL